MHLPYRLRQLRQILTAGPLPSEARDEIAGVLSTQERDLFYRFTNADQWHSLRVLRTLRDAGYNHPDLQAAALLHDIGKTKYPLTAWERSAIVMGQALFPASAEKWGRDSLESWQRPFVVRANHPEWGAQMAAAAGSRPGVVDLIRRHQDQLDAEHNDGNKLLGYLQWADDQN